MLGRALKVNKEELVAMWVALEYYLKRDHEKTGANGKTEFG